MHAKIDQHDYVRIISEEEGVIAEGEAPRSMEYYRAEGGEVRLAAGEEGKMRTFRIRANPMASVQTAAGGVANHVILECE